MQQLYGHECCLYEEKRPGIEVITAADGWLDELIRLIYENGDFPNFQKAQEFFYSRLWGGAVEGFGKSLDDLDTDSEDYAMLESLQRNVLKFSNAKDRAMQTAMVQALTDKDGKLRTWHQFRTIAYSIGADHKDAWLRSEYDLSIASAQMAAKWNSFVSHSKTLPLVQWDAVLDNRTTFTCKSLDGITVPIDHWMVDIYWPPNHWGCRTTMRQLATGAVTDINKVVLPDIPAMFQTNLAKNGLLYPPDHPYYKFLK